MATGSPRTPFRVSKLTDALSVLRRTTRFGGHRSNPCSNGGVLFLHLSNDTDPLPDRHQPMLRIKSQGGSRRTSQIGLIKERFRRRAPYEPANPRSNPTSTSVAFLSRRTLVMPRQPFIGLGSLSTPLLRDLVLGRHGGGGLPFPAHRVSGPLTGRRHLAFAARHIPRAQPRLRSLTSWFVKERLNWNDCGDSSSPIGPGWDWLTEGCS